MIDIEFDFATEAANLTGTTIIKAGGDVAVRITLAADPGGAPSFQLALSPVTPEPDVKAYLATFEAESDRVYLGTLDANDSRLITHLATLSGPASLVCEIQCTIGGVTKIASNLAVTVQRPIITGPESTEGGPEYYTTEQIAGGLLFKVSAPGPLASSGSFTAAGQPGQFAVDHDNGVLWIYCGDGTVHKWLAVQGYNAAS